MRPMRPSEEPWTNLVVWQCLCPRTEKSHVGPGGRSAWWSALGECHHVRRITWRGRRAGQLATGAYRPRAVRCWGDQSFPPGRRARSAARRPSVRATTFGGLKRPVTWWRGGRCRGSSMTDQIGTQELRTGSAFAIFGLVILGLRAEEGGDEGRAYRDVGIPLGHGPVARSPAPPASPGEGENAIRAPRPQRFAKRAVGATSSYLNPETFPAPRSISAVANIRRSESVHPRPSADTQSERRFGRAQPPSWISETWFRSAFRRDSHRTAGNPHCRGANPVYGGSSAAQIAEALLDCQHPPGN